MLPFLRAKRRTRSSRLPRAAQILEQRVLPAFDLTIGVGATIGVTETTAGVFEATETGAFLNVADIQSRLAAGDNVTVSTGADGSEGGSLVWNADAVLDYDGTGARTLRLRNDSGSTIGNITFLGQILDSTPGGDDLQVSMQARRALLLESGSSITTGDGGITLSANFGTTRIGGSFHGLLVRGELISSGGGDIVLEGRSGLSGNTARNGVLLSGANVVSSGAGDILITGLADQIPIRVLATQVVSTGSGAISFLGDDITISSTTTINAGSNAVSFAPRTSGLSIILGGRNETVDQLDLQAGELNRITAGLVRVGHLTAATVATPRIPTWNISLPRQYTAPAGWNSLSLIGRGLIRETGSGALRVASLAAVGFGGVHLASPGNAISQLAGQTSGSNFSVVNAPTETMTVGIVDGLSGISSSGGDIYLNASAGLVVDQSIDTLGAGSGGVLSTGAGVTENVAPSLGQGDIRLNAGTLPVAGTDRLMFPPVFTTRAFLIDPQNNYSDNTLVYFDAISNAQLVIIGIANPNPLRTFVLLRYDLGLGFQFDDGGANAFSFNLATPSLSPFAFSSEAEQLSGKDIGGLLTQRLRENLADGKTSTFTVSSSPLGGRFVTPVNVFTNDGFLVVNFQQWQNFNGRLTRLDPETFAIPDGAPLPPDSTDSLPLETRLFPVGSLRVFTPLAGDAAVAGQPVSVEWTDDLFFNTNSVQYDVLLSLDGGRTFSIPLATGVRANELLTTTSAVTALRFDFRAEAAHRTATARIRVVAHLDGGGVEIADSFETFAII